MKGSLEKTLDRETQLLISVGSAVAAGCIPCLHSIVGMAREEGIDERKLRAAARTGQFVKDQPAEQMKALADQLLGTHMQSIPEATDEVCCPMSKESGLEPIPAQASSSVSSGTGGCGCS
jgi:AhpD family alkylhydroperoxidase